MASDDYSQQQMFKEGDSDRALNLILSSLLVYSLIFFALPRFLPKEVVVQGLPQLYFLLASIFIMRRFKIPTTAMGIDRQVAWRETFVGFMLFFVPVMVVIGCLLLYPNAPEPPKSWSFDLTAPKQLYHLFVLVALAPVCEELFFRGLLTPVLVGRLPKWLVVLVVTLLFGAAHFSWSIGPFILGLVTTWLYLLRRSLFGCIVLHALCNALGPLLAYFLPKVYLQLKVFFL